MNSRWVILQEISQSGNVLFRCTECGRISKTPDKWCDVGCGSEKPNKCQKCGQPCVDDLCSRCFFNSHP